MSWGGVPLNARTAAMMTEAQILYGATITATQGSPSTSVGASAGTHDGEGVIDVVGADLDAIVSAMREVGFAAWHRTSAEGFTPHVHGVAYGEPLLSPQAADQITDYIEGRNGLASNAPDDGPRDWVGRTWEDYLAGNPGTGGTSVFRGVQIGIDDAVIEAGSITRSAVIFGIRGRADGTTITLTAGDEFYLYLAPVPTADSDIYSMANWRILLSGHGSLDLAQSFDPFYSYNPPFTWTDLTPLTIDTDTATLTATPTPAIPTPAQLNGTTGAVLLRVTCTTGTVTLDWVTLQVEPPAGLLIISTTSHWSSWFTPALVRHAPAGVDTLEATGEGLILGLDWDQEEATEAVQEAEAVAVLDLDDAEWVELTTTDFPDSALPADVFASGTMEAFAERFLPVIGDPDDSAASVSLRLAFTLLRWGTWPDWRQDPDILYSEQLYREVARDEDGHLIYEFEEGAVTLSNRWTPVEAVAGYEELYPSEPDDSTGAVMNAGPPPGVGRPTGTTWATYSQNDLYPIPLTILPPPSDWVLAVDSTYMATGQIINPPIVNVFGGVGWTGGPVQLTTTIERRWQVRAEEVTIDLQMPPFRYRVNEWIRSPDALDTSDPELVILWLRQRQRNDGLGNSVIRAKGRSSRQRSLRQRGYR